MPCDAIFETSEIHIKPTFKRHLIDRTKLCIGRRGQLKVYVIGVPTPTVIWMRGKTIVQESKRIHLISSNGCHKIVFDSIKPNDKGRYKVVAENLIGRKDSSTFVDIVACGPPIIHSVGKPDLKLVAGESLCLASYVDEYGEKYEVQWFKNDLPFTLKRRENVTITQKSSVCTLEIKSLQIMDSGKYTCVVSGEGGKKKKQFNVLVQESSVIGNITRNRNINMDSQKRINMGLSSMKTFFENTFQCNFLRRKSCRSTLKKKENIDMPDNKFYSNSSFQNAVFRNHMDPDNVCCILGKTLYVDSLSYEDIAIMERTLQNFICGSYSWEILCRTLCDNGLLEIDGNEIELCKHPGLRNLGKAFIKHLSTFKPDLCATEFYKVAQKRNRRDICCILESFKGKKIIDIPHVAQLRLQIQCALPHVAEHSWKILAEDLGFVKEIIRLIETSCSDIMQRSAVEEMFELLKMRNPKLTLHDIAETLRCLKFNDSAYSLEKIISGKQMPK